MVVNSAIDFTGTFTGTSWGCAADCLYCKSLSFTFWLAMQLSELRKGSTATVTSVADVTNPDAVAHRLRELGFVAGEPVRVVALAPWGGNPMVVQVGATRFALRRDEAARVQVQQG